RPDIRERILEDLEALQQLAAFADAHTEIGRQYQFGLLVEEFRKGLLRELDYRQEARNLVAIEQNLREFDSIVVPLPVDEYSTARVLTMDYIRGKKVTALSDLTLSRVNGARLADDLFRAYLQQILVDGLV